MARRATTFLLWPFALMGALCASCGGGRSLVGDGAEADADASSDLDEGRPHDVSEEHVEAADDSVDTARDEGGRCGDGVRDEDEECDDGPANSDDRPNACRTSCVRAFCGDHVVDTGEMCDDGNTDPCDGCVGCALGECNGIIDPGEECDDCNSDNTDACIGGCGARARCGDGWVWRDHEQCDDANDRSGDGCEPDCIWTCETRWDCDDDDECSGIETCGIDHACIPGEPLPDGTACCPWDPWTCEEEPWWDDGWCWDGRCERTSSCGDGYVWVGREECDMDPPHPCTTACGSIGGEECTDTCLWSGVCTPPAEACNGLDDDCDGVTDEWCGRECCTNLADDDGDDRADCDDIDCLDDPACTPCREGPEICWDGCDNDLDCRTDGADGDCPPRGCIWGWCRPGPERCDNRCDDDGDGLTECDDPDCAGSALCPIPGCVPTAAHERCDNGRDDDCDGYLDCDDRVDCTAYLCDIPCPEICDNWRDDDFDMDYDCEDFDCACWIGCTGIPWAPEDCGNGVDDDLDGRIDAADFDCPRACS